MKGIGIVPSATFWRPESSGHTQIQAGSQGNTSTKAELDDDLGLDGDDQWTARLDVETGPHRIGLEYLPLSLSGSTHADSTFLLNGATFPMGDDIHSDLDLTTWILRYDFSSSTNRKTADAMRFGVHAIWWDYDLEVKDFTSGASESRQFSKVYPGVHADLTFDMSRGLISNFYGGYATKLYDTDSRIWELSGALGYKLSDGLQVSLGYRWMTWNVDESNNDGDFSLRGPYASLALRF